MATEPFLINPMRYRSRMRHRRLKNPLGEELMIMGLNPKKKYREGMAMARSKHSRKDNAWPGDAAGHKAAAIKGWAHRRGRKDNAWPGDAAGHKAAAIKGWAHRRGRKDNAWPGDTAGHKAAAIKGWAHRRGRQDNPIVYNNRRRVRTRKNNPIIYDNRRRMRTRRDNPIIYDNIHRRSRDRFRRNPELRGGLMQQTIGSLPYIGVGAVSVISTALVPKLTDKISTSTYVRLGGQLALVFGGGYAVNKFTKSKYGLAWMIGGGSVILADLVHKYILGGVMAGLGAYEQPHALGAYEMPHALGEAAPGFAPAPGFESVSGFGDFGLADGEYKG